MTDEQWYAMMDVHLTVNCVAGGFIKTRLTEATSDGNATAKVEGRGINVGRTPT